MAVVRLDLRLPGVNGLEVARQFRKLSRGAFQVLVATTGSDEPGVRRRALEVGSGHFLVKPFELARLRVILAGSAMTIALPLV